MDAIKRMLAQYPDRVTRSDFLELAKKDERGVPQSTGPHIVTFMKAEPFVKNDDYHRDVKGFNFLFEEEGVEKKYFIPTFITDKNNANYGKFSYLFQKFADIEQGAVLEMEYVRKGARGYVNVKPYNSKEKISDDDIPVIEDNYLPPGGIKMTDDNPGDIKVEDIPF